MSDVLYLGHDCTRLGIDKGLNVHTVAQVTDIIQRNFTPQTKINVVTLALNFKVKLFNFK